MSNNYQFVTPIHGLPCTASEARAVQALLSLDRQDEVDRYHGFQFDHEADKGYLIAEESGTSDELPDDALALIGGFIARAGWEYWEFGVAWTCDKMRAGEFGGTAFRIMPDGRIVYRLETWPPVMPAAGMVR